MIDAHAIIHPNARLAADVHVGPWTVIGENVEIGEGTWIGPHVVINGPTKIGKNNKIFQFASVGEVPQDKKYNDESTWLEIGDNNVIRECCTINRGTIQGGGVTKVGNNNLFMAYVHIAHDCIVHNHTVFANGASLAGHVVVNDYAIFSGFTGAHQYCRIGAYSFIAKGALIVKDVPPYVLVAGIEKPAAHGLNVEGLRRHDFRHETVVALRKAYKIIYRSGLLIKDILEQLNDIAVDHPEVKLLKEFLETSERGIIR